MFYCKVLVGDSQKCLRQSSKIKETDFKDPVKRIRYESINDCFSLRFKYVFIVYKNIRAYILYLIKFT